MHKQQQFAEMLLTYAVPFRSSTLTAFASCCLLLLHKRLM